MRRLGVRCTSRSTSVVFPVPEGADTINNSPRLPTGLFDILHLLAHALELRLGIDDELRDAHTVGLGADGVDLAVHLLQQEIQLATTGLIALDEHHPMRQVSPESRDLLGDVGTLCGSDDLLRDHGLIDWQLEADLIDPLAQ